MKKFRLDVLRALCGEQGISYTGKSSKSDLIQKLVRDLSCVAVKMVSLISTFSRKGQQTGTKILISLRLRQVPPFWV